MRPPHIADRQKVVLLGSGFSIPFGGYSVDDLTDRVRGELWEHKHIRNAFWKLPAHRERSAANYEDVLGEYQAINGRKGDLKTIEQAIISTLTLMDGDMRQFRMYNESFVGIDRYQEFFKQLGEGAVVFTLNHDLWFERFLVRGSVTSLNIVGLPNSRNSLGEEWIAASSWEPSEETPTESNCLLKDVGFNVVKLHGGLNWRDETGSLIVMGAKKKTKIIKHPVLNRLNRLQRKFMGQAKRIMLVGYGFGDRHINETLRRAAINGCEFFVFDSKSFYEWREQFYDAWVVPNDFSTIFLPRVRHYSSLGGRVFHDRLDSRIESFLSE